LFAFKITIPYNIAIMKNLEFESFDKKKLHCCLWDDVKEPKGVIQMIHGMASYAARYDSFAKSLNKEGYIAFADDHRGHGETSKGELGVVGYDNFNEGVKDEIEITKYLKQNYKLPVQIFAHSFGSFLAQRYIEINGDNIDGILMSGSAHMGGKKLIFGKIVTSLQKIFSSYDKPDKLLYKITFRSNNKPFLSEGTENAWLNRDIEKVKAYNDDPMCGFIMSNGFYYSLMRGLSDVYLEENLNKIRKDLPLMIMSGSSDPVGGMGVKVKKLYEEYTLRGLENVSIKLYQDVRHELTSDFDGEVIVKDIIDFFNSNIK